MDERIDPQSYGPEPVRPPMMDMVEPLAQALQSIEPEMAHLVNSVGSYSQKRDWGDILMSKAFTGQTVEGMWNEVNAAKAADMALDLAGDSADFDDTEFDEILSQLDSEVNSSPQVPQIGNPKTPPREAMALSALLSLGTPEHAFNIGAAPFMGMLQQRDQDFQQQMLVYKANLQKREEKIGYLKLRLQEQSARDIKKAEERGRLRLEEKQRVQSAIARISQANIPGDALVALEELQGTPYYNRYKAVAERVDKELTDKWNAEQEARRALTAQREAQEENIQARTKRIDALLPWDVKDAQLGHEIDHLKKQLIASDVRMLPQTEKLMRLRVEAQRQKNSLYPVEVANRAQMAQFYAALAAQNFQLAVEKFNFDKNQFNAQIAEEAYKALRSAEESEIESLKEERDWVFKKRNDFWNEDTGKYEGEDAARLTAQLAELEKQIAAKEKSLTSRKPPTTSSAGPTQISAPPSPQMSKNFQLDNKAIEEFIKNNPKGGELPLGEIGAKRTGSAVKNLFGQAKKPKKKVKVGSPGSKWGPPR